MPKRKTVHFEDERESPSGVKPVNTENLTVEEKRLRQDLNLSKGERQKGPSPAYAAGKQRERKEK